MFIQNLLVIFFGYTVFENRPQVKLLIIIIL